MNRRYPDMLIQIRKTTGLIMTHIDFGFVKKKSLINERERLKRMATYNILGAEVRQ